MSAIALPTASAGAAFRTEADLVRAAARSDRDSFEELYRRHSQPSWRLAQAVSSTPAQAADAVAEGFGQVLRGLRRRRLSADSPFRPALLTEVYRAAMDQVRTAKSSASSKVTSGSPDAGPVSLAAAATVAAFRSLPERWRAAVWLTEVEQMERPAVAIILGVSVPVAGQLVDRGRQGLLSRFSQADVTVPAHLGSALRPLAAAVPATMEGTAIKRWKGSLAVAPSGRLAPAQEWLAERAARPLGIACGGLVALGMVGLGVLTVASSPASTGPAAAISAPPASAGAPVNPSPGGHNNLLFGPDAGASAFANSFGGGAGFGTDALTASGGSTNPILAGEGSAAALAAAAAAAPAAPAAPTPAAPTGGGNPGSPAAPPGGGVGAPAPPPVSAPPPAAPLVNVPGVIAVNQPPSGGLGVAVGSPTAPVVGATITPTCTGVQILNIQLNTCQNPPNSSNLLSGVTGLVGNLLK
jgi:DNA-directed RNA polymerase specialized sigma24 family protein